MGKREIGGAIINRASAIRYRTWAVTASITVAIAFFFIVRLVANEQISIVDLIFAAVIQLATHFSYFPDGDLFGQKDPVYIANKTAYNQKATAINENRRVSDLREFCIYDYEERKKRYIINECGAIGITLEELEELKKLSPNEIKKLREKEINGKLLFFSKKSAKRLYRLIYEQIPVEQNDAETILSAVSSDYTKAIRDGSQSFRRFVYIKKILTATILALFLAYVGYRVRDGITVEDAATVISYLASMICTAVFSFTNGEKCSKVHRNKFYIDLANYMDCFFEWLYKFKKEEIKQSVDKK